MLADMTAGLHSYTENDAWVNEAFSDFRRAWTARELVDVGIAAPPDFPPGKGWHYSNTNYVLLGMILAQVAGKPLGDALAERIFTPLGLAQNVVADDRCAARAIRARRHEADRCRASARTRPTAIRTGRRARANWSRRSTTCARGSWLTRRARLVSPAMQRERLTWMTMPPNTAQRAYGIGIGHFGGWLGHTGELPGYNTTGYYLPSKRATIVVAGQQRHRRRQGEPRAADHRGAGRRHSAGGSAPLAASACPWGRPVAGDPAPVDSSHHRGEVPCRTS
jgi:D-alanyl-D-alanine carboxypeptidase